MKCKYHPSTELEIAEVITTSIRAFPYSANPTKIYHDVEYCPECFIEHEDGKIWRNDLVDEPLFKNITKQVDEIIDGQIYEGK